MSNTRIADSPGLQKFAFHSTPNYSRDGNHQNFTTPKLTAPTVRLDMFATPPKPHILSRRYSLSDIATPPRITRRESINKSSFNNNLSGPLLASTKFNVNVSTYEETKSPGLVRRIVQYNEEIENEKDRTRPPTHQAKYGSPGLFPIVHLFKKSPPTLEQRPKRVKVRISSPGYIRQQSDDYKLKLLEGIVKPRSVTRFNQEHLGETSTSTRSVLDALKEISRKRIHASEEYDINKDSGKRQRTDFLNGIDTNKRTRDDTSSLLDSPTSPSKPISKRVCMYDEYSASCSSTVNTTKRIVLPLSGSKRKSISTSTLFENPKETKQVKLINAETQTNLEEEKDKPPVPQGISSEKTQETIQGYDDQPTQNKDSPLRVFDDAPLERIRKNRLATLMGSLTGKDPVLTPKPTFSSILNGNTEKSDTDNIQNIAKESEKGEKPLISILTTSKLAHKSEKHVHFNIPETTGSAKSNDSSTTFNTNSTLNKNIVIPITIKQTSKSNTELPVIAPPSSPVKLKPPQLNEEFEIGSKSDKVVSLTSTQETSLEAKSTAVTFSIPSFLNNPASQIAFGTLSTNSVKPTIVNTSKSPSVNSQSLISSAKVGGFKFDLSNSKSDISKTSTTITNSISFSELSQPTETTSTPIATTTSIRLTFGTTTTTSSSGPLSSSSASPFKFGVFSSDSQTKPKSDISELKKIVPGPTFSFSTTTTTNVTAPATTASTTTSQENRNPTFSFNASKTTTNNATPSPSFCFGDPKPTPTTTVSLKTTNINFGTLSNSSGAEKNSSVTNGTANNFSVSSSGFGSSTPSFGISNPNSFETSTSQTNTKVTSSSSIEMPTTAISSFGTPITSAGSFGALPTSRNFEVPSMGFGIKTSTAPSFGMSNNSTGFTGFATLNKPTESFVTTEGMEGFGTSPASIFGGKTGFTAPTVTTSSNFGNSAAANLAFNNASLPAFGQNTSPSFGNTTTASFGSNTFNTITTTASSVFGASTGFGTTSNSSTNIFGGPTTQPPGFGSLNAIFATTSNVSPFENTATTTNSFKPNTTAIFSFGAKTTTASGKGFGANPTSTGGFASTSVSPFGSNNTFGGSSNFGNTNTFGSSSTPGFGVTTTQPNGFGTQNSGFGTPDQGFGIENKPVFGSTTASTFGTNTTAPVFGSTSPSTAFGTSNNSPSTFVANTNNSSFGKPQINSFGTAASNNFGSTTGGIGSNHAQTMVPFGNPNTSTTNAAPVFNFGSGAAAKPGVFSFGGTSSTGEIPKPAFNFTGGVATPAFGANSSFGSSAPSFGSSSAPQFGTSSAVAPNMFNIGSSSPSPRNRTVIRAKRRT